MVFETLVAASIYSGAITYLHHDGPPKTRAGLETQTNFDTSVADYYEQQDNRSLSAQNEDVDPADLKGESIWAKNDGNFDDWAK